MNVNRAGLKAEQFPSKGSLVTSRVTVPAGNRAQLLSANDYMVFAKITLNGDVLKGVYLGDTNAVSNTGYLFSNKSVDDAAKIYYKISTIEFRCVSLNLWAYNSTGTDIIVEVMKFSRSYP